MALIEFTGGDGRPWRVWAVRPDSAPELHRAVSSGYRAGWLAFECPDERRRLRPIPDGWDSLGAVELWRLCESAPLVPRVDLPDRSESD